VGDRQESDGEAIFRRYHRKPVIDQLFVLGLLHMFSRLENATEEDPLL
jgi:hypothetical protein